VLFYPLILRCRTCSTLFPYTTLFRSVWRRLFMLSVGQKLQIEPIFEQNVQDIYPLQTTIVDYNDQVETFQVERPVSEGKTDELAFKQGTLFNIVLIEEDGEVYQFESELLSIDDGEEMVYEFNLPEQFKRIQRRAYVRVDIETEIK